MYDWVQVAVGAMGVLGWMKAAASTSERRGEWAVFFLRFFYFSPVLIYFPLRDRGRMSPSCGFTLVVAIVLSAICAVTAQS